MFLQGWLFVLYLFPLVLALQLTKTCSCSSDKLFKEIRDLNFEVVVQVDIFLMYIDIYESTTDFLVTTLQFSFASDF